MSRTKQQPANAPIIHAVSIDFTSKPIGYEHRDLIVGKCLRCKKHGLVRHIGSLEFCAHKATEIKGAGLRFDDPCVYEIQVRG